ncbi:hypothetical protein VI817_001056 [Penicillium citrinum]|uniref:Uncharacterized protein n=1 Tax=Penicillium hetheringtonii TaxID=911720 RepID=A0AAD6E3B6_9EURO|nr:hypothetical protein N7450_001012 [Penicillium hetheringtonii]KAK5806798.1 hypothetical protein VI817_001056 [Penicillium citrinum]
MATKSVTANASRDHSKERLDAPDPGPRPSERSFDPPETEVVELEVVELEAVDLVEESLAIEDVVSPKYVFNEDSESGVVYVGGSSGLYVEVGNEVNGGKSFGMENEYVSAIQN